MNESFHRDRGTIVDRDASELVRLPERYAVDSRVDREPPRVVRAALVAVVLTPIVVAVVRALVNDWFPIGDSAQLYIRARDVCTADHPLLGAWTSASLSVGEPMNNPGVLYDDLLAPIARSCRSRRRQPSPSGRSTRRACGDLGRVACRRWVGDAALDARGVRGDVVGARQRAADRHLAGPRAPAAVPAYLVLMIGLACGEARWLPFVVGVASVLVQTHISYVFVLTAVTATALVVCVARQLATAAVDVAAGAALQDRGMDRRRGDRVLGAADLGATVRTRAGATSPASSRTHPAARCSWALGSVSA